MDRFTRTREHYLRGAPRKESSKPRAALGPSPPADLTFDFNFGESKLDLTLALGGPANHNAPLSAPQARDPISDQIGIAISDDTDSHQRGRLRISKPCTITIQNHKEQGLTLNQDITALPSIPGELRIKFNAPDDVGSKKPSCSIYSREGRRQARGEIFPPGQPAGGSAAADEVTRTSKVASASTAAKNLEETNSTSEPKRSVNLERELSAFTKVPTDTSPSPQSQTTLSDQRLSKNKTKRSSTTRRFLSIFKRHRKRKSNNL
ncbi:hypothetical protein H2200_003277 [Cladophialophora chaetospira]|uniref:Uncharacterized protein n=1 Tax=Cladophialophora chaetospira TaxID=386627 RepID=A0AA38XH22_9EURO|nr:hypothetical protein H2200_003277 [Cladophialophora chaetospira]